MKNNIKEKVKTPALFDLERSFASNIAVPTATLIFSVILFGALPWIALRIETKEMLEVIKNSYNMIFTLWINDICFVYIIIYTLLGVIAAFNAFKFINSKSQVNVYLSMGISRKQLFRNRLIACLSMLAVSAFVPMILNLAINSSMFGFKFVFIQHELCAALSIFAAILAGFTAGMFGVFLSGSAFESIALTGTILSLPSLLCFSAQTILKTLLRGYFVNDMDMWFAPWFMQKPDLYVKTSLLNPLLFTMPVGAKSVFESVIDDKQKYGDAVLAAPDVKSFAPSIIWLLICVLAILAAYRLFTRRRAELAGMYGASNGLNIFCSVLFALAISTATLPFTKSWGKFSIIFTAVAFALLSIIFNIILARNLKIILKNLRAILPAFAVLLAAMLCVSYDVSGYCTRIPDVSKIDKAYVSVNVTDYVFDYGYRSIEAGGGVEYFEAATPLGPFETEEDLKLLTEILESIVGKADAAGEQVFIRFDMKNGSVKTLSYKVKDKEAVRNLLNLYKSDYWNGVIDKLFDENAVHQNLELLYENDYQSAVITQANKIINSGGFSVVSPMQNRKIDVPEFDAELRQALAADLKAQNVWDFFMPSEPARAIISFMPGRSTMYLSFYISESMENTMTYLEKSGYLKQLDAVCDEPISVTLINADSFEHYFQPGDTYSPQFVFKFADGQSNEGGTVYTDREMIEYCKENAVETYYNVNGGGCYVLFAFKGNMYTCKFIEDSKILQ